MAARQQDLVSRFEVEDAVIRMFVATDERDWQTVESCFTDPFTLDMTSMVGGSPATMTPRQVADAWADGFKTLDHVHHQVGNLQTTVDGQRATVRCYGIAFHYRAAIVAPMKSRTFVGTYEIDLSAQSGSWRISRLKFKLKFIEGNLDLEKAE
jgi:3-phenylpropionate/cinnamic acid dioxygenase small subunit